MSGCFACGANGDGFFAAAKTGSGESSVMPWLWFFGFAAAGGVLIYWLTKQGKEAG